MSLTPVRFFAYFWPRFPLHKHSATTQELWGAEEVETCRGRVGNLLTSAMHLFVNLVPSLIGVFASLLSNLCPDSPPCGAPLSPLNHVLRGMCLLQRTMSGKVLMSDKQEQHKKVLKDNIDYRALKRSVGHACLLPPVSPPSHTSCTPSFVL